MKKVLLITILSVTITNMCLSQTVSKMYFPVESWDFGRIKEIDGTVEHTFEFINKGTKPFVIESVSMSCGCIAPKYTKEPIMPGAKSSFTAVFDPSNRPGSFDKELVIASDQGNNINKISLKGFVIEKPKVDNPEYQYEIGGGFKFERPVVYFNFMGQGTTKIRGISCINSSGKSITIAAYLCDSNSVYKVFAPKSIPAKSRGVIDIGYDLTAKEAWGILQGEITFTINGVKYTNALRLYGIGTDNFPAGALYAGAAMPQAEVTPQYCDLGNIKRGGAKNATVTITNRSNVPLAVRAVKLIDGVTSSIRSGTSIPPGKSIDVSFTMTASANPGQTSRSVYIIFNDPRRPMQEIRLSANVLP